MTGQPAPLADNQTYYFAVGQGVWRGRFSFQLTDREALKRSPIGLKHRLLAHGMSLVQRLMGDSRLDSRIWADPGEGDFGVARNVVRISRFRLTLYLLREQYTLDRDGTNVVVNARERFGPIPFLFRNRKEHPAEIHAGGLSSTYYMPLLGEDWTADYTVDPGQRDISGVLRCPWAHCTERMAKL
ncbi:MAG: hypothetical protein QOE69_3060 [Thermoleophilaceae bacterium]|nr:hypothetical protein [Thermoleophilaceae bacterium]